MDFFSFAIVENGSAKIYLL